ncbi:structure-specific endonuclease subunit SLX4-like [Drosophila montana]|uniref:structure-specific endonuclease subunit SLX4-like n=1 Tax=Drosophila montana TaxID=40370 RepID=UPI00313F023D
MDRQTRRANFKKLQQPANTKLRSTRSTKATSPMTLSEYFNTQESSSSAAAAEPENLYAEPRSKKTRDVEPIKDVVKPKKAPKLKSSATQRRARGGRGKKQPTISDFLRNEQLFAEVTAQHCIADNFSPDDIEMALVLSKSEAEKHGRLRLEDTEDEREEVVNLLDDKANQSTENVRRKLQKYGFRTAAKEDYNLFSIAALPGAPGKRGKRCKWANKFTPLTLRNPAAQEKKLQTKVAALMAQQVRTKLPSAEDQPPFELISKHLLQLAASAERRITHEPSAEPLTNLSAYYVQDLIEVSRAPAHHLLKNWSAIQGRDLSPKRPSAASQRRQQQLQQVYAELEAHFGASAVEEELNELEKLVADNMIQDDSQVLVDNLVQDDSQMTVDKTDVKQDNIQLPVDQVRISLSSDSSLKEPPDKRARMMPELSEVEREKENLQPSTSAMLSLPTQSTRCISPDLFADSDDEPESETPPTCSTAAALEMQNFSLKVYRNISSTDMNSYEVYSSDEDCPRC